MKTRSKLLCLFICVFYTFFLITCKKKTPVAIQPKEHACKYCQMKIIDLRFNAQLVTPKGKVYHFDSIECLFTYHLTHHPKSQFDKGFKLYVKDFLNKKQYLEAGKALYMQSNLLSSPMGANLSAYHDHDSLNWALKKYKGNALNFKQAHEYVSNIWFKRH